MTSTAPDTIGLGLAALGRPAYITSGRDRDLGQERSVDQLSRRTGAVLDAAYAAGVRYVDCARSYGLSERFLGRWLHAHPEITDVTVASKWGYRYVGDWRTDVDVHEVKDHSLEAFETQLARTRTELGDRLDIYQIHSVTPESPALTDTSLIARLAQLRDTGLRIGLSTSGPHQADTIRQAIGIRPSGQPLFTVVQATWNLLESSAGPALADTAEAGAHVVVKEVLANGRLAPGTSDHAPAVVRAGRVAAECDVSVDRVAIAAAVHQPWAGHVLSGAATPDQVVSNVQGARLDLTPDILEVLLGHPQDPGRYWQERSERAWR